MTRKRFYWIGGIAGAVLLTPLLAWWWFFHTTAGVEFLLTRLDRLKGMTIVAHEVSGTLAGPLSIKRLELDQKYVRVEVDEIELDLLPVALLTGTIRVSSLRAAAANVTIKTVNEPPSTTPLQFLPNFLRVSVGEARFEHAHVTLANGTIIEATPIATNDGFSMSASRMSAEAVVINSTLFDATGQVTLLARRPVGLEADVQGTFRPPSGPAWEGTAHVSGDIHTLELKVQSRAPAPVIFDGVLVQEPEWWLRGKLASDAFSIKPWLDSPPLELERFKLDVNMSIAERLIAATGEVFVPQIDAQPMYTDVALRIADRALRFEHATAKLANSDTEIRATGLIDLSGDAPKIDARAQWRHLRWPLRGGEISSPSGTGTLAGFKSFAIDVDADLLLLKQTPAHVNVRGKVDPKVIDIRRYEIAALKGEMHGSARLELNKARDWRIELDAKRIDPQWFNEALPGRIDVRAQAKGQGFDTNTTFDANIERLSGVLRGASINARGGIARTRDGWTARGFNAVWGANLAELDGELGRVNNMRWRIDAKELERIASDLHGEFFSQGAARGTASERHLRGEVRAKNLQLGAWRVAELTGNIDLDPTGATESQLSLNARDALIGSVPLKSATLTGNGTYAQHTLQFKATMPAESYEQVPVIELSARGEFVNGEWRGTVSPLKFSDHYGRAPTLELPDAPVFASAERVTVNQWCLVWSDKRLCADGSWIKGGLWRVAFASDNWELNLFDPLLGDKTQMTGLWQVDGHFESGTRPGEPWRGEAVLRMLDAKVLFEAVENAQETVEVGGGLLVVNATEKELNAILRLASPSTTSIDTRMRVDRSVAREIATTPLTVDIEAHTSDANLLPLFFADLDSAAGTLDARMRLTGTLSAPLLNGRIALNDGSLDFYRINFALRDFDIETDIADNRLQFDGKGRLGEGTLRVSGNMEWQRDKPTGALRLRGESLLVSDLPEYRIVASPDIRFAIEGTQIDVRGDVSIPTAVLAPADLRGAVQRSPDARLVDAKPAEESSQFRIDSDISVRLGEDVRVNALGLQAQLGGTVQVIAHPSEQARGRGEVFVRKGNYRAYGQDINIERGRLLFDSSPLDNPGLDILATRIIEDQTVGVNVRGTLRTPRMSFYADPSLPQMQIVAYLLTGKPAEDMRTQDAAAVNSISNTIAMQGGGLLASQLGNRIGIEQVSFESKGANDTSLVLGKFLSPRLFVSYGISLTESINTLKARYTISNNWLLKAEAGVDQSADVEFRIER